MRSRRLVELYQPLVPYPKRSFTPGPEAIRNKTYPLRTVIDALSTYSLGYSLEDTVARVKSKSGRRIGASTIAAGSRSTKTS